MRVSRVVLLISLLLSAHVAHSADEKPTEALTESVRPFIENHTIAGAVLVVASRDRVLDVEAIGYSDIDGRQPMTRDTLFWIASMNKAITATAVMMLIDEGKLKLDDPIRAYLPEFGQQKVGHGNGRDLVEPSRPVAVRDILAHTAGIVPDCPLGGGLNSYTLRDRVLAEARAPLRFDPGSKWEYSNGNFETAGRLVEVVSGVPYDRFLQTRLFKPLGMTHTTFRPDAGQMRRLARSYRPNPNGNGLAEAPLPFALPLASSGGAPNPAGGLFSTAQDVSLFCRMLLNGGVYRGRRYLSPASVRRMTTDQTNNLLSPPGSASGYGLGLVTTAKENGSTAPPVLGSFGHAGAYGTQMWVDPDRQLITVLMISQAGWPVGTDRDKVFLPFRHAAERAFAHSERR